MEEEKKRRLEVEKQLQTLQAQQKAALAASTQSDIQKSERAKEEYKDKSERVKAREIERERQQKQHKVS